MNKNLKEKFITKANKIYNFQFDYVNVEYINNKTQIEIKCIEHNIKFMQRPDNHLHGFFGCKKCSSEHRVANSIRVYGVEHITQVPHIKRERNAANLIKYGNICSLHDGGIIEEKTKQTNLERYGVECIFQSEKIKQKIEQTNLERYGFAIPARSEKIKEKTKQTNLLKYGVENATQQHILSQSLLNLNNKDWLYDQHIVNQKSLKQISKEQGVSITLAGKYLNKHGIKAKRYMHSEEEIKLNEFIQSLNYNTETNVNDIIPPYEIDIFIPDLNIALEYNGLFWHKNKGINYHKNKTDLCKLMNIHLIHVWEDQWLCNQENIKEKIIKIINNQPLHELTEELIIDLSLEDTNTYLSLGYKIDKYLLPSEYQEDIWDCGKAIMDK